MSIAECAAIVERGDLDRFLAAMSTPVAARRVLFPLYAFNVEVSRAPWASKEPMICEMRLQWWADLLDEISEGAPARAHEVATPLFDLCRTAPVPLDPLRALVQARRWDIYSKPFEDAAEFDAYIEASSAGLMWCAARALGTPEDAEGVVRKVGWAAGLASFLRAIPALEARGKKPLADGRPEAVAALAREGLARLGAARQAGPPRLAIPALRAGWRAEQTLRRAASEPGRVAEGALEESDFARRAALLRRSLFNGW